jgi:hypothetical protein
LKGCKIKDPEKSFFYLKKGIMKINSSKLSQSDKAIPISVIEEGGKVILMKIKIE